MAKKKTGLEQVADTFREEASERLTELEAALLALESDPDNADLVASAFRALHTIKGSGAMFGFDDVAQFAHEVETAFDLVRNGKLAISKTLIGLTLRGMDLIKAVRAGTAQRLVPIIMLTTESQEDKKQAGRTAGATAWIVKPFTPDKLVGVVKKVIG